MYLVSLVAGKVIVMMEDWQGGELISTSQIALPAKNRKLRIRT